MPCSGHGDVQPVQLLSMFWWFAGGGGAAPGRYLQLFGLFLQRSDATNERCLGVVLAAASFLVGSVEESLSSSDHPESMKVGTI